MAASSLQPTPPPRSPRPNSEQVDVARSGVHPIAPALAGKALARRALIDSGLTQEQLATAMGVDASTLAKKLGDKYPDVFSLGDVVRAPPEFQRALTVLIDALALDQERAPLGDPEHLVPSSMREDTEAQTATLRRSADAVREHNEAAAHHRSLAVAEARRRVT